MGGLIRDFFVDVINSTVAALNSALTDLLGQMLKIESSIGVGVLSPGAISRMYQYIYTVALALLVVKFLFKGFSIYILWRDGDADASPQDMLIGAVQATVVAVAFPTLYDIMVAIVREFAETLINMIGLEAAGSMAFGIDTTMVTFGLFEVIVVLVYLVIFLVLYIKLIGRGFELLVLRLGVPIACMGLIDSDYGVWKSYMQILYKALLTSVIQVVLLSLSLPVIETGNFIMGVAIICAAFSAPVIMQQILVPTGRGGGLTQKIYTGTMAVRAFGMLRGG